MTRLKEIECIGGADQMIWAAIEKQQDEELQKHAGGKAREDLDRILLSDGIKELSIVAPQDERWNASIIKKIAYHFGIANIWKKAISKVNSDDALIIQFPVVNHTLFFNSVMKFTKKKGIKMYAVIHDLEVIRMANASEISMSAKWRMKREEVDELKLFDAIIVHNSKMKKYLNEKFGIQNERMVELGVFDYLIENKFSPNNEVENYKSCIIAGNLNRNKSAYIYNLPSVPDFELYGINFEGQCSNNIHYHGSFLADELPFHLQGGFGLVWDGDSTKTCNGAWGEYLKYNNPHKTSLYLACGIPVIIWKGAALADFILKNRLGFTIESLDEIGGILASLSSNEYIEYKKRAMEISNKFRSGFFTKTAIKELRIHQ